MYYRENNQYTNTNSNNKSIKDFGKRTISLQNLLKKINIDNSDDFTYSLEIINKIAEDLEKWAYENHAKGYANFFTTIFGDKLKEKQHSFLNIKNGKVISKLKGSDLIATETDGSSFPTSLRETSKARSYVVLDKQAEFFIYNGILYIPGIFITPNKKALDIQEPFLRSINYLKKNILKVAKRFDSKINNVKVELGWELEFFLIDKKSNLNEDIKIIGKSLVGSPMTRDQEEIGHYFSKLPYKVSKFMDTVQKEASLLGIPIKCRHAEVAPNQFEFVYLYDDLYKSANHCFIFSLMLEDIAEKYNYKVLFNEKPFPNMNGSGKHLNISISINDGINLFDFKNNEDKKFENLSIALIISLISALYYNSDILMESIFSYSNEKRLGGHEAPPSCLSVYLGTEMYNKLMTGDKVKLPEEVNLGMMKLLLDVNERNRTSPFAFTGNRFEFRSVGSHLGSEKFALTALNTILGAKLEEISNEKGDLHSMAFWNNFIVDCKDILFEGDGYTKKWQKEIESRGLKKFINTADALKVLKDNKTIEIYEKSKVFDRGELNNLYVQKSKKYINDVRLDFKILRKLVYGRIIPAIEPFIVKLNLILQNLKNKNLIERKSIEINEIECLLDSLHKQMDLLEGAIEKISDLNMKDEVYVCGDGIQKIFREIRNTTDRLEMILPQSIWPLERLDDLLNF